MRSLRAREFLAIGVAVIAAVAVTAVVAALLVRRSVKHEALKALARQAALIAAQERATTSPSQKLTSLGAFFKTQQERLAIISIPQAALLLPGDGATAVRAGRPAQGSVDVSGKRYLYAASPVGRQAIVLLRSAKLEASDWRPFTLAFVIAAAAGAGIAGVAAFLLAGAVARPIGRVALASRRLAAGETHGPLPVEGSSEVASLALAFNQMAEGLDRAKDAERSFLLSVSHELKTPLASIRGHGEALLDRVLQVLSNLIENALRSTPAGGRVTVAAGPGEVRVADTGPGLAPEDLPRAFERFYLHSRYGTNRGVGTGLGLAIVKELTEAMDGSVTVELGASGGTTFIVRLPRAGRNGA